MKKFLLSYTGVVVMTLIALVFRFGIPMVTKPDTKNKVVTISDEKKTGYALQPGYALIDASWSKAWKDAKEKPLHTAFAFISLICAFVGPFAWFKFADGKDGKGLAIWGSLIFLYIMVLVPHYIVPTALKYSDAYTKKICLKEYQEGKNYDYLFPETDEQNISFEQFENSCR